MKKYWNALPSEVVEAVTLATFNTYFDRHMDKQGIEGYKQLVR